MEPGPAMVPGSTATMRDGAVLSVWLQANGADEAIDALLEQKAERIELVLAGKRKTLRGIGSIGDVARAILGNDGEFER